MLKIALTGGIATGKSYVVARLKDRGIPTIDADDLVHEALGPGTPATRAVAARFGDRYLKADGSVNRPLLGSLVFSDPDVRQQVEAIVHPIVYDAIHQWFSKLNREMGIASIPLLYETGRESDFDVVLATVCPPELQLQRLLERDRISQEEAMQRIAAQMPAEEKAARANFAILTGGTKAATDRQVDDVLTALGASPA